MTKQSLKNHERALKWDKKKVEKAVEEQIGMQASLIVDAMMAEALTGSFQHGSYLLDRAFGKVRQNIGVDGGEEGAPIVFMPAALVAKFALDKPLEKKELPEYVEEKGE